MTTVKVHRQGKKHHHRGNRTTTIRNNRRMTIKSLGSDWSLTVPYSPNTGTHSNLAPDWEEVNRVGQNPIVVRNSDPRPRMNFTLYFGDEDWNRRCDDDLRRLSQIARSGQKVQVSYSSWESGLWRISSLSFDVVQRHPENNEITRANVTIEFVLVEDLNEHIGPLTGGVRNTGGGKHAGAGNTASGRGGHKHGRQPMKGSGKPRRYTVKKGDTLIGIAIHFYHDHTMWRKIAKENNVRNPRRLQIGKVLRLP